MGEGQTSGEFDDWCTDILSLPPKIEQVFKSNTLTFYNQCVVFQCLVNTTAEYVQRWWIEEFEEEMQLKKKSALEVGKQLLAVLKRGLQLLHQCADEESREFKEWCRIAGCAGEFAEIIDDVKMYSQMMTGLAKEQVSLELQPKVELDCSMMQIDLTCAIAKDRKFLIEKESSSLIRALFTHELLEIPDSDLEIQSALGEGAFTVVNKAKWRLKVPVAIKEFLYEEDLSNEFKIIKKLKATNSPHVLQTFGHTTLRDRQDRKGVVMELMDLDLEKLIELEKKEKSATPFSLYTSIDIMLQIGKGVRSLHELNVVHRDISPTKILVKARENGGYIVKLGGLTVSKTDFKSWRTNTDQCGDRRMYMALEMEKDGKYTRKVDVYSFGVYA